MSFPGLLFPTSVPKEAMWESHYYSLTQTNFGVPHAALSEAVEKITRAMLKTSYEAQRQPRTTHAQQLDSQEW